MKKLFRTKYAVRRKKEINYQLRNKDKETYKEKCEKNGYFDLTKIRKSCEHMADKKIRQSGVLYQGADYRKVGAHSFKAGGAM